MSTGVITSRYAAALLKYTEETGSARAVYDQVAAMLKDPSNLPSRIEPTLANFISLVERKGRTAYLKFIFHTFLRLYNEKHDIHQVHLSMASSSLEAEDAVRKVLGDGTIVFESETDPSLIGGFVLRVDDLLLDASVSHQLDTIRRQFIKKNRRIV